MWERDFDASPAGTVWRVGLRFSGKDERRVEAWWEATLVSEMMAMRWWESSCRERMSKTRGRVPVSTRTG